MLSKPVKAPYREDTNSMRQRAALIIAVLAAAAWCGPVVAQAQPENAKSNASLKRLQEAARGSPWIWDVQMMINDYVGVIAGYYNLTEKQEEYTRQLMNQRVKQFLRDYEKDVRTLLGEYQEYRMRKEMPTPEAARDFARRAAPLVDAIRQEILDGNMQWRRILNEEQLKKHDHDLDLIHRQFDSYSDLMKRWSDGNVRPFDVGMRDRNVPMNITKVEDAMGIYVRNFIAWYDLDAGQRETAGSILREAREEVARYRESHKTEFAELEARQSQLTASNPKGDDELKRVKEEGRKLTERRMELEKPLNEDLFARFKERLNTIPTADQKARYESRQNTLKEKLAKMRRSTGTTLPAGTQPADSATTAPASK